MPIGMPLVDHFEKSEKKKLTKYFSVYSIERRSLVAVSHTEPLKD